MTKTGPFAGAGVAILASLAVERPALALVVLLGPFGLLFTVVGAATVLREVVRRHVVVVDVDAGVVTEPRWGRDGARPLGLPRSTA